MPFCSLAANFDRAALETLLVVVQPMLLDRRIRVLDGILNFLFQQFTFLDTLLRVPSEKDLHTSLNRIPLKNIPVAVCVIRKTLFSPLRSEITFWFCSLRSTLFRCSQNSLNSGYPARCARPKLLRNFG